MKQLLLAVVTIRISGDTDFLPTKICDHEITYLSGQKIRI